MAIALLSVILGFCLDLIFGDPHWLWHPVRAIGALINFFEKFFRKIFNKNPKGEKLAGLFMMISVILISTAVPLFLLWGAYKISPWLYLILHSLMCYQIFAVKSLKTESMKVYKELKSGNINSSRKAVSMIVGRDTENLDEKGIIKATVETIAENTSDGVIAPMLYMFLFGAVGGFFYKAVNTMDSMVGYKNEKYINFGFFPAKFDDVLNFIPSRIAGLGMIIASSFMKFNHKNAWRIFKRDRFNHASPNSAQTEAVMAGALEIELAGDAYYFGKLHKKKTIGDNIREPKADDIVSANMLLYMSSILILTAFAVVKFLLVFFISR